MQGADIQRIGGVVAEVLDQRARGAADGAALRGEDHVAVAAEGGVARPFVAWHEDEAARRIEDGEGAVEIGPAFGGDLEVVALVADGVHAGEVARIAGQGVDRAGADRLPALPVQVGPVWHQAGRCHAHRVRDGVAPCHHQRLDGIGAEACDAMGAGAGWPIEALGQAGDRGVGREGVAPGRQRHRVAPAVIGAQHQRKRLPRRALCRQDRQPPCGWARHDRQGWLLRQQGPIADGDLDRKGHHRGHSARA